jgi:hypothetical protein
LNLVLQNYLSLPNNNNIMANMDLGPKPKNNKAMGRDMPLPSSDRLFLPSIVEVVEKKSDTQKNKIKYKK